MRPASILGFRFGRADAAALAALAAVLVLFFHPLLWQGRVLFFRDIAMEIVPKKIFQARSGAQLLWNPLIGFGQPLAANPQEAAFYPPAVLFHLGDVLGMLSLYVVLHFAAAMFFTYLLARARSASVAAAAFAAVAFGGGGFFVSCGNQIVMLNSVTWLPALIWAADRALMTGAVRFAVLAGLFWGLQVLGGEAEIAALSGVIAAVYLASRLRTGGSARAAAVALAAALVVALGLSAVQWLLTLEYLPLSNRAAGYPEVEAGEWALEPARLVSLLAPEDLLDPNGQTNWVLGFRARDPYLLSVYPGLLCVLLAALGAVRRRGNLILLGASAVFVWASLGPEAGLYRLLLDLPGFNRFRMPERCLLGFALFMPLLAADGLDRLRELYAGRRTRIIGALTLAAAAVLAALGLSAIPAGDPAAIHQALLAAALAHAWALSFAGFGAGLLLAGRGRASLAAGLLVLALAGDLFLAHRYAMPTTERKFYSLAGNLSERLPAGLRRARGVISPSPRSQEEWLMLGQDPVEFYRRQRLNLSPFTGLELGLADVAARSSLYPADQDRWLQLQAAGGLGILRLSGIWFGLEPGSDPRMLPEPFPRALVVGRALPVAGQRQAMAAVSVSGFDPGSEVVLETVAPVPAADGPVPLPARVAREDNQTVEVTAQGPGWLVLLDAYYPGWEARVNGQPMPVLRANAFFRAVRIGAGAQRVVFRYRPWRFFAGAAVSLATLVLAAGVGAAGFFRPGRLLIKPPDQAV